MAVRHDDMVNSVVPLNEEGASCLIGHGRDTYTVFSPFTWGIGQRSVCYLSVALGSGQPGWSRLGEPLPLHQALYYKSLTIIAKLFSTHYQSVSSAAQLCPTLHDPMDCSMPGFPVHHQILELTQRHVHWVGDAIQLSHPLSSPSPPAFNLSQHKGLFQWVSSSYQVAKVLDFQLQHQFFQWIFRTDFL